MNISIYNNNKMRFLNIKSKNKAANTLHGFKSWIVSLVNFRLSLRSRGGGLFCDRGGGGSLGLRGGDRSLLTGSLSVHGLSLSIWEQNRK